MESLTFHLFSRQVEVHQRGELEPILDALRGIGMEGRRLDDALRRAEKTPVQTFMERFSAAYTPAVLCMVFLVAAVPSLLGRGPALDWAYRALVMLVFACPCAIVLAAPVVTLSALTRATREGILVKGARHLEAMGTIRVMAFDKTGTLTLGRLQVTRVRAANGWKEEEVLRLAGAVAAAGSSAAMETADVALMTGDLAGSPRR